MANEYTNELKAMLAARPNIKKVYFDAKGNHYFNAFPKGDGFVVGNKAVTAVLREDIIAEEAAPPKALSDMKLEELKAVCIDSQYPIEEWQGMKKKTDLVDYINGKQSNV